MKAKTLSSCILLLAVAACQQMASTARAAVTFSVTPSAVSNFYAGTITLQIGGLNPGETVQIDKFLDANGNGVIDAADLAGQSFLLTDGQASVFYDGATAVTNINVPGDLNRTSGTITAQLRIGSDIAQQIVAQYIFRLSSPTNRFTPQTTLFNVTNSAYAQSFTGAVQCSGSSVPNAVVMVTPGGGRHGSPFAGVMANNTGNYTLNLPAGSYGFYLFKSNYVCDLSLAPTLTLNNGATFHTNLTFLIPATNSVSGHLVDAANTNTGLPDVFMICETPDRQFMAGACYTGTNGAFTVPVIAGQWQVSMDSDELGTYGYLGLNNNPQVDTTAGSVSGVTMALPKGTALFYGSVLDNQGHPLAGIDISCSDNNGQYYQDYYTDANGYFVAPVVGGLNNDLWQVEVSSDNAPTNYLFAQPAFNQDGGTNLNTGQALLVNFTAVLATNNISGSLKDNSGNPIVGVGVWADATINGVYYNQGSVDTGANGNYSLNVADGTWTVGVNSGGGGDSLPGNYLAPANQTVVISNNNATVNFTALLPTNNISGSLTDNYGNPIAGVGVWANATINSVNYFQYVDTAANGNYSLGVINGTWNVGVETGGGGDSLPGNYLSPPSQSVVISNNNGTANFTAPLANNYISGYVQQSNGNPIGGVGVWASATINSVGYFQYVDADGNGNYSLGVINGNWTVGLEQGSSSDSLDSILGSGNYQYPGNQNVTINNSNAVVDFTVQPVVPSVPDVFDYFVTKLEAFLQVGPANLVLNTNFGPFNAYLGLVQSAPDTVSFAVVVLPTGAEVALPLGSSGLELETRQNFSTQAAIDAAYPPGNYTFHLDTVDDGTLFPVLTNPAAAYPNPPQVSNFAAAQSVNPLSPFTLQWNAIPGATTNDFLWVFANDTSGNVVFSTPEPSIDPSDALSGTATSVVIPINTFQSGQAYTGWIILFHTTSVNMLDYPGAAGLTIVAAATSFPLALAFSSLPMLSQPARPSDTQFGFLLSGVPGQNYTVLVATNAARPLTNWSTLLITNLSASPALIQDNQATNKQRFYRVKVGP
ncbi:MAG: hypothetical protein ACLQU3_22145 [Limisphaerales bacterium]